MRDNYKTPSEAAQMMCPFTFNRPDITDYCIHVQCMAWRWDSPEWETVEVKRDFDSWEDVGEGNPKRQIYKDGERVQAYLSEGYEVYWPSWVTNSRFSSHVYKEPEKYMSSRFLRRKTQDRRGFCGLAEPRISEVSVGS